jgi:mono/diheme cytochrome c family protein
MPTYYFSDEEAIIMERYFSKVAKQEFKYEYVEDRKIPKDMLQAAKLLYSKDYFDCFSCHQIGDKKPEGDPSGWAPDLTVAWQRLKPEWIENWIRDPQAIQPGTKMPSYYPDSYPDDILGGDPEKQIRAMKDYLMSLRKEERY